MMKSIFCAFLAMAGILAVPTSHTAQAQQKYPTKPIMLVVPFAPGGATDIVARLLAAKMGEDLGQSVVVENRAGGAGNIGSTAVARSEADGYTLLLATTTQLINQFLFKDLNYNLFTDLVPVALIADAPEVLAVNAKMPAKSMKEFADVARKTADGLNYGSAGNGSVPHLGGEILAKATNTKMVHVPFRGTADAMRELAAGNVHFSFTTQASVASFIDSGHVKILAIAAPKRLSTLPDVPTTAEAGFPNVELSNWFGIMAPRGTPAELVLRLNQAFNKALADPKISETLVRQGIEPVKESPEYFAKRLQDDAKDYKKVLEDIGLSPK